MPLLEEVLVYIKGLWLLIQGNLEGYRWLDIRESGLWRSFTAILWTLPALAVGWASWRLYYLSVMPTGTTVGIGFFGKLLAVDLVSWLLPIVLIAVLSRPARLFRPGGAGDRHDQLAPGPADLCHGSAGRVAAGHTRQRRDGSPAVASAARRQLRAALPPFADRYRQAEPARRRPCRDLSAVTADDHAVPAAPARP
jgi:hypothetical protein